MSRDGRSAMRNGSVSASAALALLVFAAFPLLWMALTAFKPVARRSSSRRRRFCRAASRSPISRACSPRRASSPTSGTA